jgi:hypothetical protein
MAVLLQPIEIGYRSPLMLKQYISTRVVPRWFICQLCQIGNGILRYMPNAKALIPQVLLKIVG